MFMFDLVGRIFPRKFIRTVDAKLQRAGSNFYAEEFLGFLILVSLALTIVMVFLSYGLSQLNDLFKIFSSILVGTTDENSLAFFLVSFLISLILVFGTVVLSVSTYLDYKEEQRKNEIEKYLPDYLMLIAANVKSGVLIEHAVWDAAKPEFGLLSSEMAKIAKLAIGGKSLPEILELFNSRIGSKSISQLVALLKESIASGGEIAKILEQTASELRAVQILQREIASSMLMYGIFVLFAAFIMSPLLFALSFDLVDMLNKVFVKVPPYKANIGISVVSFSAPKIKPESFYWFSIFAIILTNITSLMMYGVFRNGHYTYGLRLLPFALVFSILFYIWMVYLLSKMFVVV